MQEHSEGTKETQQMAKQHRKKNRKPQSLTAFCQSPGYIISSTPGIETGKNGPVLEV